MAQIKGLTIAIGADMKEFNKEMRKADRTIRSTSKEVQTLEESLKVDFDSERFEYAMKKAQDVISLTEEKIKALKAQMDHIEKHEGVNSENYVKLRTELVKTESNAAVLKKRLEELNNFKLENLSNQFKKVGDGISKVGQKLMPISAAASGAIAAFTAMGLSAAKTGGELDDIAMQMDMTAEAYQKLAYVAAQTGAEIGRVERAFVLLRDTSGKALLGETNKSTEALQRLGFTLDHIRNTAPDDLFYQVVKSLASMEDQTLQSAYATEIFNQRVAHDILPLLRSGANAVEDLTAEFEQLGYLSNEQVANLAAFDDSLLRIKTALGAVKDQIGAALLPIMEEFAAFIENRVVPAIRNLADWFINLDDSQKKTIATVTAIIAALAPALLIIGKLTTGIGGLIKGVAALSKALTFLSAHPIIAIIGIISALIMIMYTRNEQFRESINQLIGQLSSALMPLLQVLMKTFNQLLESLMPIIDIFSVVFGETIRRLTPLITMITRLFTSQLVPAIELVGKVFSFVFGLMEKGMKIWLGVLEKIFNGVIDVINYLIQRINKLGDVLGFSIKEIERIDLTGKLTHEVKSDVVESASTPENVLSKSNVPYAPQTVINNDYSNKEIAKVEVVVENYAREVDVDDLVQKINIELAKVF